MPTSVGACRKSLLNSYELQILKLTFNDDEDNDEDDENDDDETQIEDILPLAITTNTDPSGASAKTSNKKRKDCKKIFSRVYTLQLGKQKEKICKAAFCAILYLNSGRINRALLN